MTVRAWHTHTRVRRAGDARKRTVRTVRAIPTDVFALILSGSACDARGSANARVRPGRADGTHTGRRRTDNIGIRIDGTVRASRAARAILEFSGDTCRARATVIARVSDVTLTIRNIFWCD